MLLLSVLKLITHIAYAVVSTGGDCSSPESQTVRKLCSERSQDEYRSVPYRLA